MSEFNPNDPLESFLRKTLHDLNETPPDEVWDGIQMRLPKVEGKSSFPFLNTGFILIGFALLSVLAYQSYSSKQEISALQRQVEQLLVETKKHADSSVTYQNPVQPASIGRGTKTNESITPATGETEVIQDKVATITAVTATADNKKTTLNSTFSGTNIISDQPNPNKPKSFDRAVPKNYEVPDEADKQAGVVVALNKLEAVISDLQALNYQPQLVDKLAELVVNSDESEVDLPSDVASETTTADKGQLSPQMEKEGQTGVSEMNAPDAKAPGQLASPLENKEQEAIVFSTMTLHSLDAAQLTTQPLPAKYQELVWPEIAEAQIPKLPKGKWTLQGYGLLAKDRGSIKNLDDDRGMSKHGDNYERTTSGNSYGYGLRGQYHISRKWAVISGLEYQDNQYQFQHLADLKHKDRDGGNSGGTTDVDPPPPPETEFTFHYDFNSFLGTSHITFDTELKEDVNDEIGDDERIEAEVTITRRQQYIAVPLLLERNWKNKSPLYFSVKAGLMTKWLVRDEQKISAFDFENEFMVLRGTPGIANEKDKKGSSQSSKVSYDYVLAAGLHCDLSRRVGIMLEPRLTGLIGPRMKTDDFYINHFTFGVNTLLYYRF